MTADPGSEQAGPEVEARSLTPVGDWIANRWPPNPGATHYTGPGDDPGCCAGGHVRCTYLAGWREALRSLAAELGAAAGASGLAAGMACERAESPPWP